MTDKEREQSGCPYRLCGINNCDYCKASKHLDDVTGFVMCEVDWESCPDYIAQTSAPTAAR